MSGKDFSDSVEFSASGSPIVRHTERDRPFELAIGSADTESIARHIETHLGKVDVVWHEVVSDMVHIDLHHVTPTPDRDFHTLVTSGMSDRPMNVPAGSGASPYAELVLCLPPTWPLDLQANASRKDTDPRYFWPLPWLKYLARIPHEFDTWFGMGHTLPNGDPPSPLHSSTRLCGALFLPPLLAPQEFWTLRIGPEKAVHFWAVVPLYAEELRFKLEVGLDPLLEELEKVGVTELLDVNRKNACAGRFKSLWSRWLRKRET